MITESVIVETKCCSVSQVLAVTSRQVSSVISGVAELHTHVAFTNIPLNPIRLSRVKRPFCFGALNCHTPDQFDAFQFSMAA